MNDNIIDLDATVYETCFAHPQIPEIMAVLGFNEILEPGRLETMGKMMTIRLGSQHKGVPLEKIIDAFHKAGFRVKGIDEGAADDKAESVPESAYAETEGATTTDAVNPVVSGACTEPSPSANANANKPTAKRQRDEALQGFLKRLQAGESVDDVKDDFARVFQGVAASEIAAAEQALINSGEPMEEVQRLCDVHATLFGDSVEPSWAAVDDSNQDPLQIPGHPLNTLHRENEAVKRFEAETLRPAIDRAHAANDNAADLGKLISKLLTNLTAHYKRKEDLLFPHLEAHGVEGPSKVMWGIDDENRHALKEALHFAKEGDAEQAADTLEEALTHIDAMIFKETNILIPMAAETLNAREWRDIAEDSDEYAYCLIGKPVRWRPSMIALAQAAVEEAKAQTVSNNGSADDAGGSGDVAAGDPATAPMGASAASVAAPVPTPDSPAPAAAGTGIQMTTDANGVPQATVQLPTGSFNLAQLNAMLDTLPLDITFVDDHEIVRYFSHGETRAFARPKSCLGRDMYLCHPPKSVPKVKKIIEDFKSGTTDHSDFWIHIGERFMYIRYFAVRDAQGTYLGALEVTQDIAPIQALEGENRRGSDGPAPACD